jgi:inner membrane protein
MSPVTHFLASWALASFPRLQRRDVALVTFAGVAPDLDGLGVIPELLTRHTSHPLEWFTRYHHLLAHNLPFAILVTVAVLALSQRRWLTASLAFVAVHLHFLMDVLGSRGPDGYNWPIPYFEPFSSRVQIAWSGQWALNSWQNVLITCGLLVLILIRAVQISRSPLEIFSPAADKQVVAVLRQRWSSVEAKAAANRN